MNTHSDKLLNTRRNMNIGEAGIIVMGGYLLLVTLISVFAAKSGVDTSKPIPSLWGASADICIAIVFAVLSFGLFIRFVLRDEKFSYHIDSVYE